MNQLIDPSHHGWVTLNEVGSTQVEAATRLRANQPVGVVFALHQTQGRGRFGRAWESGEGDSLTFSLTFPEYADHPRPWTIGMAIAVAVANALDCHVQWPNDLVHCQFKLGGILTELVVDSMGRRVPIVGIGINLNQLTFPPEIQSRATSLRQIYGETTAPLDAAKAILAAFSSVPSPEHWSDVAPLWMERDETPGKLFKLPSGQTAKALGIGPEGEMICEFEGRKIAVHAADALFGPPL